VIPIIPNDASLIRLIHCVVAETHDKWQVAA